MVLAEAPASADVSASIQSSASLFDVSGEIEMDTLLPEGPAGSTGHEAVAFLAVLPGKNSLEMEKLWQRWLLAGGQNNFEEADLMVGEFVESVLW